MPSERIIIGERYELREPAGQGGMATVWRGVMHGAAGFSRLVAVKKIKPEYHAIQSYIDMFIEEARVGSDLAHPNIVQIHDFIIDDEGSYYLIMEWVEGVDLGTFARAFRRIEAPVPWQLMAAIAVGALRGLGAAHERRRPDRSVAPVIHRDVSPQNILLGINGVVKLTDFGLARARDRAYSLTAPGTVKGKLSYLAPEVTYGKTATPLSDLFSMGNVLWESLTGRKLFQGSTDLDIFKRIRKCEVPTLAHLRPDIPTHFAEIITRALARDPGDRFASARIMAKAIVSVLNGAEWREDAHTELGEMVSRIRNGRDVRITQFLLAPDDYRATPAPARAARPPQAPALLDRSHVDVEFSEPTPPHDRPASEDPAPAAQGSDPGPGAARELAPAAEPSHSIHIDFNDNNAATRRKPSGKGKKYKK